MPADQSPHGGPGFPSEQSHDWSERFFSHPDYLTIYRDMTGSQRTRQELGFCERVLRWQAGERLLDAPCGAGRHSAPLAQMGLDVTGLDFSGPLLRKAQRREPWQLWRKQRIPKWVRGLLQALPFATGCFDYVVCLFSSFGYLDTEADNLRVMQEYHRVLRPGGMVLIDVMNRHFIVPRLNRAFESVQHGLFVHEERRIINQGRRLHNALTITDRKGETRRYLYRPWLYNGWELSQMAVQAGLEPVSVYGSFEAEMYHAESERAMLVARKP